MAKRCTSIPIEVFNKQKVLRSIDVTRNGDTNTYYIRDNGMVILNPYNGDCIHIDELKKVADVTIID